MSRSRTSSSRVRVEFIVDSPKVNQWVSDIYDRLVTAAGILYVLTLTLHKLVTNKSSKQANMLVYAYRIPRGCSHHPTIALRCLQSEASKSVSQAVKCSRVSPLFSLVRGCQHMVSHNSYEFLRKLG